MSEFDRYLERLCMRAGRRLSEDAERELRQHFDEAVAAHLVAGRSRHDAELDALGELGRPEVVGIAFRRAEAGPLRRLAGGPGALLADLRSHWHRLLLATALTGLIGAGAGQLLPPSYTAYAPLRAIVAHYNFGNGLAASYAISKLQSDKSLQVSAVNLRGAAKGTAANPADATRQAQAAAQQAEVAFRTIIKNAPYGGGGSYLVTTGAPRVGGGHPVTTAALVGGGTGLLAGSVLALRRRRGQRGGR